MNQFRLALLRMEPHLPGGIKQGSCQVRYWKTNEPAMSRRHRLFCVHKTGVGGLTVVPMQTEFQLHSNILQELQSTECVEDHPRGVELTKKYSASNYANYAISCTRSHRGDIKALTFDIPIAYKKNFPQQVHVGHDIFQVTHRGGVRRTHKAVGLQIYNETNPEHWERVIQKGLSPTQRKSVLIPDEQAS